MSEESLAIEAKERMIEDEDSEYSEQEMEEAQTADELASAEVKEENEIRAEWVRRKSEITDREVKRDFFKSKQGEEVVGGLEQEIMEEIADYKEKNIDPLTKPKDGQQNIGQIIALRRVLSKLRGLHWDDEIESREIALEAYEEEYPLFLGGMNNTKEAINGE